jgi:hypothetical protein
MEGNGFILITANDAGHGADHHGQVNSLGLLCPTKSDGRS